MEIVLNWLTFVHSYTCEHEPSIQHKTRSYRISSYQYRIRHFIDITLQAKLIIQFVDHVSVFIFRFAENVYNVHTREFETLQSRTLYMHELVITLITSYFRFRFFFCLAYAVLPSFSLSLFP